MFSALVSAVFIPINNRYIQPISRLEGGFLYIKRGRASERRVEIDAQFKNTHTIGFIMDLLSTF